MIRSLDIGGGLFRFFARRWLLIASLLVVVLLLAACGGPPPVTSWPGYVVQDNLAYLASADQLVALDIKPDTPGIPLIGWPVKSTNPALGYYAQPALSPDGQTLYVGTEQLNGNSGLVEAWVNIERGAQQAPTIKWTYPLTTTDPVPGNIYGALVLDDGVLYFGDGAGNIMALSADTGRPVWQQPVTTGARIWSAVVVDRQNVYAASQDHILYAINRRSGNVAWKFPSDGNEIDALVGSPAVADDTVYVGSFGGSLYAIDAASGNLKWTYKAAGTLWDGPAVVDGILYFGDLSGNVYALDAATGQSMHWTQQVTGGVKATPLVQDGIVYVGTDQDRLYAFKADNGQAVWAQPFQSRAGENLLNTPVLNDGMLLVLPNLAGGDPVRLYAVKADNGAQLWRYPPQSNQ
jgi:outer membrane protein assembly factor BamB